MNEPLNPDPARGGGALALTLPPAGLATRGIAWFVDVVAVALISNLTGMLLGRLAWVAHDTAQALQWVLVFVVYVAYGMVFEWVWQGQTLGKRLLRLRVVDQSGLRLESWQVVLRNLLRLVDSLPMFYLLAGAVAFASRRGQRLGDLAAHTLVVQLAPRRRPLLAEWSPPPVNSLRQFPHLEARLRRVVPAAMAELALRALLRRDELDARSRVELFEQLARDLVEATRFPREPLKDLSDEQIVANFVDSYYRFSASRADGLRREPEPPRRRL